MNVDPPEAHELQALVDHAVQAGPHPDLQAIVVVPARDEAPHIATCLQALSAQLGMAVNSYEVILILDGCRDDTFQVVQETTGHLHQLAFHIVTLLRPQGVGRARRLGMDIACRRLMQIGRGEGLIVSTDADTAVAPDWLLAQLTLAKAGAEAIGGLIELDLTEGQALAPQALAVREQRVAQRLTDDLLSRAPAKARLSIRTSPAHRSL